jgi:hypothetical protein
MKRKPRGLTLAEPAAYEICVSGELDGDWHDWFGDVTIERRYDDGRAETIITGTFDQTALHGVIRRIYSLGFPLISVKWV